MHVSTHKSGILVALMLMTLMVASLFVLLRFSFVEVGFSFDADSTSWWRIILELAQDDYYQHVTWFSLYQAFWSTVLSVGLAIPVAHALFHSDFKGKRLLLSLFSTTLVLPVLVGVFGVLAILGNSGWLASLFERFDSSLPFSIYGLGGILIAHVFFNLPYASRLLLQALQATPIEQRQLCQHLGMSAWQQFRLVEWPRIRTVLPALIGLVFMLCFTSFSVVMILGGGPKATTLELLIYQAIKFEFNLTSGAILALWQMLLCVIFGLVVMRLSKGMPSAHGRLYSERILGWRTKAQHYWQVVWIIFASILVLLPLFAIVWEGINTKLIQILSGDIFWRALSTSFAIAILSAMLALTLGVSLVMTSRSWRLRQSEKRATLIEWSGNLVLITPAIVLSTGLFLMFRNFVHLPLVGFSVVVIINSVMALPYVIHTLSRPMFQSANQYQYLCASLGLSGWRRFYWLEWQALKPLFLRAFAISLMVSMGDLSAIALFGNQGFITLPLYLYQLLGSYQMAEAAVVSLCLLITTLGVFWLMEAVVNKKD